MSAVTGKCLCGGVAYRLRSKPSDVTACHCSQCRRTSGHYWAAFSAPKEDVEMTSDATLAWHQSSDWARRGFCNACGSSLFYDHKDEDVLHIAPGTLDGPTGLDLKQHIFTADKGDYYQITDGKKQIESF